MSLSFVTDLAKSTISRAVFGKDQPNINFTVGELVEPPDFGFIWSIFNGTKKVPLSAIPQAFLDGYSQQYTCIFCKYSFRMMVLL